MQCGQARALAGYDRDLDDTDQHRQQDAVLLRDQREQREQRNRETHHEVSLSRVLADANAPVHPERQACERERGDQLRHALHRV